MASTPKKVEEIKPDREVVKEARKMIELLVQQRTTAIGNLQEAIRQAKLSEQQSLVLRGKISAYEEQIEVLQKRHGIKEIPS